MKLDINITVFSKDFSVISRDLCLGIEDTLSNSDFTNLAECPLTIKETMHFYDFILKCSVIEQFLQKWTAMPLIVSFLEDFLRRQVGASR